MVIKQRNLESPNARHPFQPQLDVYKEFYANQYVVTCANKANNFVIVCKKLYLKAICQELGINCSTGEAGGNTTCISIQQTTHQVIQRITNECATFRHNYNGTYIKLLCTHAINTKITQATTQLSIYCQL